MVPGLDHPGQPIPVAVAGGGFVFSSPIGPRPLGGGAIPPDLDEQITLTFENVARVLAAAQIGRDDVMFVRVFVSDMAVREPFNVAWEEFFGSSPPARQVTEQVLPAPAKLLLRITALEP